MKPSELKTFLVACILNRQPVLVESAPGYGKSDIIAAAAIEAGADEIKLHPVVDEPIDYKGLPVQTKTGADFIPFGNLKALMSAKKLTVVHVEDLIQAPESVQAALMQLILGRQVNGKAISDKIVFIASTNRRQDKAGGRQIIKPLHERFTAVINLDLDNDDWQAWANQNGVSLETRAFLRWKPALLVNPRLTVFADRIHKISGLPESIKFEAVAGRVGEGYAAEFYGFLRVMESMPDPAEILKKPNTAPLPGGHETSIRYAIACALGGLVKTEKAFSAAIEYLKRFGAAEWLRLFVLETTTARPELKDTKTYIGWATEYDQKLVA
jgi:hypothetical protein